MPRESLAAVEAKELIKKKQRENMHETIAQDQRSLKTPHHQAMQRRRESTSKNTSITQHQ